MIHSPSLQRAKKLSFASLRIASSMASEAALSPPDAVTRPATKAPPEQRSTLAWLPRDIQLKIWEMKEEIERAEHEVGWTHVMHDLTMHYHMPRFIRIDEPQRRTFSWDADGLFNP
jgi:hypothetical protein